MDCFVPRNDGMEMRHLLNYNIDELKEKLLSILERPFKVNQILQWIFTHHILDFNLMTNISTQLRDTLSNEFDTSLPKILETKESTDKTVKFLLELNDDTRIETVFMPDIKKNSICISSQVGCARDCVFCATAKLGLKRNLTQAELLSQIYIVYNHFPKVKITNLVLMGMGEPLDNYDIIISFIKILEAEEGLSFSGRRITLSTCGIIPKIYDLADSNIKLKLAISLNSAINENRSKIMSVNKIYPLDELKKALLYYRKKTRFRITFEYVMIENFNMSKADIKAISKFCGDISCKLNLIKWNEIHGLDWKSPSDKQVENFVNSLKNMPFAITLRKSRGADIRGACGQLAGK